MRHVTSALLAIAFAPVIWACSALGAYRGVLALRRYPPGDAPPEELLIGAGLMVAAGLALGVLLASRLSPLGPALAGLACLGAATVYLLDVDRFYSVLPTFPQAAYRTALAAPVEYGWAWLVGIALLVPVVMPSRWRRTAVEPAPTPVPAYPAPPPADVGRVPALEADADDRYRTSDTPSRPEYRGRERLALDHGGSDRHGAEPERYEPERYEPERYEPQRYQPQRYRPSGVEPGHLQPVRDEPAAAPEPARSRAGAGGAPPAQRRFGFDDAATDPGAPAVDAPRRPAYDPHLSTGAGPRAPWETGRLRPEPLNARLRGDSEATTEAHPVVGPEAGGEAGGHLTGGHVVRPRTRWTRGSDDDGPTAGDEAPMSTSWFERPPRPAFPERPPRPPRPPRHHG